MQKSEITQRAALTRPEFLVVFFIVVVVVGLSLPFVLKTDRSRGRTVCQNNFRALGLACHNANDVKGSLPPYDCRMTPGDNPYYNSGGNYGSLFYHLLPFIENTALFQAGAYATDKNTPDGNGYSVGVVKGTKNWAPAYPIPDSPSPLPPGAKGLVLQEVVKTFICPSDPTASAHRSICPNGWAGSSYAGNFLVFGNPTPANVNDPDGAGGSGKGGSWGYLATIPGSFPDGTSNTILFVEKYLACGDGTPEGANTAGTAWAWANHDASYAPAVAMESPWNDGTKFQLQPAPDKCQTRYPQTGHVGGMAVVMADGSGRWVAITVSALTWQHAMQPNDGCPLGSDW
jgi:hypothetical protein